MLNEVEKIILENLDPSYKYIARDRDGNLCIYIFYPDRDEEFGIWTPCNFASKYLVFSCYNHLFQSIKWEDEEPYKFR